MLSWYDAWVRGPGPTALGRTEAHVTWGVTENLDEFGSQMVTFWMHHVASISAAT